MGESLRTRGKRLKQEGSINIVRPRSTAMLKSLLKRLQAKSLRRNFQGTPGVIIWERLRLFLGAAGGGVCAGEDANGV